MKTRMYNHGREQKVCENPRGNMLCVLLMDLIFNVFHLQHIKL